jgi:hypothetical protein
MLSEPSGVGSQLDSLSAPGLVPNFYRGGFFLVSFRSYEYILFRKLGTDYYPRESQMNHFSDFPK